MHLGLDKSGVEWEQEENITKAHNAIILGELDHWACVHKFDGIILWPLNSFWDPQYSAD